MTWQNPFAITGHGTHAVTRHRLRRGGRGLERHVVHVVYLCPGLCTVSFICVGEQIIHKILIVFTCIHLTLWL